VLVVVPMASMILPPASGNFRPGRGVYTLCSEMFFW